MSDDNRTSNSKAPRKKAVNSEKLSKRWSVRIENQDWETLLIWSKDREESIGSVLRGIVTNALNSDKGRKATDRSKVRLRRRETMAPEYLRLAAAVSKAGNLLNQIAHNLNAGNPLEIDTLTSLKNIEDDLHQTLNIKAEKE